MRGHGFATDAGSWFRTSFSDTHPDLLCLLGIIALTIPLDVRRRPRGPSRARRVDLPTEVAPDDRAGACRISWRLIQMELEVSSTDRQVDLVQEGSTVYCARTHRGLLDCPPLGLLRVVNAASPAYLARHGVRRSLEDLQRRRHRSIRAQDPMGISGRLKVTRRFSCPRFRQTARRPAKPLPSPVLAI